MNLILKTFIISVAKFNEWLAQKYIPKNTWYCYTLHYIHTTADRRSIQHTTSCPYNYYKETPDCPGEYDEWCHYINGMLDIQDSCKDCMINTPPDRKNNGV